MAGWTGAMDVVQFTAANAKAFALDLEWRRRQRGTKADAGKNQRRARLVCHDQLFDRELAWR